jgi:hypothetical protein
MISPDETLTNSSGVDPNNPFVDYALPDGFFPGAQSASCFALPPLICPGFEWVIPEPVVCPGVDLVPPDLLPIEPGLDGQVTDSGEPIPPTGGFDPVIDGGWTDAPVEDGLDSFQPEPAPFEEDSFATTMALGEEGGDFIIHNCWLPPYLPFPDTSELPSLTSFAIGEESGDQFDPSGIWLDGKPAVDEVDPWVQDWSGDSDSVTFDDGFSSEQPTSETEIDPEGSIQPFISGVPLTDIFLDGFDPAAIGSTDDTVGLPVDQVDFNLESGIDPPFDPGSQSTNDFDFGTIEAQDPNFDIQPISCTFYTYYSTLDWYEIPFVQLEDIVSFGGDGFSDITSTDLTTEVLDAGDGLSEGVSLVLPSQPDPSPADFTVTTCAMGEESGDGWLDPWEPIDAVTENDSSSPFEAVDPSDEGVGGQDGFISDIDGIDYTYELGYPDIYPIGVLYDEVSYDDGYFDYWTWLDNPYYFTDDSTFDFNIENPVLIACFDQVDLPLPCEPLFPDFPLLTPPSDVGSLPDGGETVELSWLDADTSEPLTEDSVPEDSISEVLILEDSGDSFFESIDWTMPYGYITKAFGEDSGGMFEFGETIFEKESPLDLDVFVFGYHAPLGCGGYLRKDPLEVELHEWTSEVPDPDPIPLTTRGQDSDGVIKPWYRTVVTAPVEGEGLASAETSLTTSEPSGSNPSVAVISPSTVVDAPPTTSSTEESGSGIVTFPVGPQDDVPSTSGESALPTTVTSVETPSVVSGDSEPPATAPAEPAVDPFALFLLDSGGPAPNPPEAFALPLLTAKS